MEEKPEEDRGSQCRSSSCQDRSSGEEIVGLGDDSEFVPSDAADVDANGAVDHGRHEEDSEREVDEVGRSRVLRKRRRRTSGHDESSEHVGEGGDGLEGESPSTAEPCSVNLGTSRRRRRRRSSVGETGRSVDGASMLNGDNSETRSGSVKKQLQKRKRKRKRKEKRKKSSMVDGGQEKWKKCRAARGVAVERGTQTPSLVRPPMLRDAEVQASLPSECMDDVIESKVEPPSFAIGLLSLLQFQKGYATGGTLVAYLIS